MKDLKTSPTDEAKIELSHALLQVSRRHPDLGAAIGEGHRRILKRRGVNNLEGRKIEFSVALAEAFRNPEDRRYDRVRIELVDAFLEAAYKLRPVLNRYILDQVRDNALAEDKDHDAALSRAMDVMSGKSNGAQYMDEQQAANRERRMKDRAAREQKELEAVRRRVKREKS